jgi:hypothetical protein
MSTEKQTAKAVELDTLILETEKRGSLAIMEQAISLCDMQDSKLYEMVKRQDDTYYPSWRQYITDRCASKSDTTIAQMIVAAREFRKEITKEGLRCAAIGIEKMYTLVGLISGGFIKREDALKLGEENTVKRLREMRVTGALSSEGLGLLVPDKFPKVFGSIMENNLTRMQVAMGQAGEKPSRIGAMEHLLNVYTQLPDDYLVDQVKGEGGLPTEVLGYDIETTAPAALVNILVQRYVDDGHDIEKLHTDITSALGVKTAIAKEIKAREEAEVKAKAARKEAAGKAISSFVLKVQSLREADKVTFGNGLVAEIAVVEATGQKVGLRLEQDGKDFFAALAKEVTGYDYKGGNAAMVSFSFALNQLEGIKSVEKFKAAPPVKAAPKPAAKPAPKPTADKLSKAAQAGKGKKAK